MFGVWVYLERLTIYRLHNDTGKDGTDMATIIDLSVHRNARRAEKGKRLEAMEALISMARDNGADELVETLERIEMQA